MLDFDDTGVYPVIKNTEDNTSDIVDYINTYCQQNNIKNSKGEVIYIDKNKSNPIYMMLFGVGYLNTMLQKMIRSAANSMSIQDSNPSQLHNIADILKLPPKAGAYTYLSMSIQYSSSANIYINQQNTCSVILNTGKRLTFEPLENVVLPYQSTQATLLYRCTEYGAYTIEPGIIQSFDVVPSLVTGAAINISNVYCWPGALAETDGQLRERLQDYYNADTRIDKCITALRSLPGIVKASIMFNPSVNETISCIETTAYGKQYVKTQAGPFVVPPRRSLIFIHGTSDSISKEYYKHLLSLTADICLDESLSMFSQPYTTISGQVIPFWYTPPIQKPVKVYLRLPSVVSAEIISLLKQAIFSYINDLNIGSSITDGKVLSYLTKQFPELTFLGCTFSYSDYTFIVHDNLADYADLSAFVTGLNDTSDPTYDDYRVSGAFVIVDDYLNDDTDPNIEGHAEGVLMKFMIKYDNGTWKAIQLNNDPQYPDEQDAYKSVNFDNVHHVPMGTFEMGTVVLNDEDSDIFVEIGEYVNT